MGHDYKNYFTAVDTLIVCKRKVTHIFYRMLLYVFVATYNSVPRNEECVTGR